MREFRELLNAYRNAAHMSCNELARTVGVDPSYISRLERGEREPPRRHIVLRLAEILELEPEASDALLASAGYIPECMMEAISRINACTDPSLEAVRDVLLSPFLSEDGLVAFRAVIICICKHWGQLPQEDLRGRPISITEALSITARTDAPRQEAAHAP